MVTHGENNRQINKLYRTFNKILKMFIDNVIDFLFSKLQTIDDVLTI